MANDVTIDIRGNNRRLQNSLTQSESLIRKFGRRVTQIFTGVGLVILARKFYSLGQQIAGMYKEQIQAEARLQAVLQATGNAAGFTFEQLKKMASMYQHLTGIGDDVILNTMAIISTFKNIRNDQFKETLALSIDLAEVLQTDLKSAALQVSKALNDPARGMVALRRAGVSFTKTQESQIKALQASGNILDAQRIIIQELKEEFGGASEEINKSSRIWSHYANRMGDAAEVILQELMPAINVLLVPLDVLTKTLEISAKFLSHYRMEIVALSAVLSTGLQNAFGLVLDTTAYSTAFITVALARMSERSKVIWVSWQLSLIQAVENGKHYLTVVAPTYMRWFARHWSGIWDDVSNYTATVTANMWSNLQNFFNAVASFVSGGSLDFEWKALTDGFQMTLRKLPKIAERELGATERIMMARLTEMVNKMDKRNFFDVVGGLAQTSAQVFRNITKFNVPGKEEGAADDPTVEPERDKLKPITVKSRRRSNAADRDNEGEIVSLTQLNRNILEAAAGRGKQDPVVEAINKLPEKLAGIPLAVARTAKESAQDGAIMIADMLRQVAANTAKSADLTDKQRKQAKEAETLLKKISNKKFVGAVK